jgi:quercetin dioxygenase-like cupin family protein
LVIPYEDTDKIRVFSKDVLKEHLVWHRDRNDRTVTILEGEGWKFQRDNELPISLSKGDTLEIEAYSYHRIIKGNTDLKIKIEEH